MDEQKLKLTVPEMMKALDEANLETLREWRRRLMRVMRQAVRDRDEPSADAISAAMDRMERRERELEDEKDGGPKAGRNETRAERMQRVVTGCMDTAQELAETLPPAEANPLAAPGWMFADIEDTVEAVCRRPSTTPEELHGSWLDRRERDGWKYAPKRDDKAKTDPMLQVFAALPRGVQQLGRAIVLTAQSLLAGGSRQTVETGGPEDRNTGGPEDRETGRPGDRKTERPEDRETERPEDRDREPEATDAAKLLAETAGIPLSEVPHEGKRITKTDVERAMAERAEQGEESGAEDGA